jgi:D-xylose transport system permease protein
MTSKFSIRDASMGIALFLICAFFALHPEGGQFLSPQNLSNLSIELAITATLALGMLLVLLPGMIDLSVGSGVGMLGGIASVLIIRPSYILGIDMAGWPAPVALLAALLIGMGLWYFMGRIIAYQKVPAFIITLGGLLIFNGIHWLVIRNSTIPVAPGGTENILSLLTTYYFPAWGSYAIFALVSAAVIWSALKNRQSRKQHGFTLEDGELTFFKTFIGIQVLLLLVVVMNLHKGLPLTLVILGVVAWWVQVLTRHMRFGRYLYAIGGNEEAARLSGIPVEKVVVSAFVALGAIVALTGFMQTAYGGYSTTTVGKLMELDAIAACVIGGTSLKGGRGTVLGVLFGALIMATLLNGMTLLAVSPEMKLIARGTVLVLAVWMDVYLARTGKAA